ncbi:MAG: adenylyltransferase [Coxiella sp. (in: Bacteria)]|nr:MAG: adenylyltransferase [Coxiella sp. (in: g-proteobacteria)]
MELSQLTNLASHTLTDRELCDLELIMNKGFLPLTSFMNKADYDSVCDHMRLADGSLWPMPIVLSVSQTTADTLAQGQDLCLRDHEGYPLAIFNITELWIPDKNQEAESVFGTLDPMHPAVDYLFNKTEDVYLGGTLTQLRMPRHYDFTDLRRTPTELKTYFKENNIDKVVAFQTRNPMHRAHFELTWRAATENSAHLLLNPVVGVTKPGDIDYFTRVRCYKHIMNHYQPKQATLSLLPLAMRMAGPREALWHALIRKNHGCTHFIIGRDHAGPGKDSNGNPFYDPYGAQELVTQFHDEIGITMVPFKEVVYVKNKACYKQVDQVSKQDDILRISGTEFRDRLRNDKLIPEWFSYPEVIRELRRSYPSKHEQGFMLFFTGLSGSGKSTLANAVMLKLMELDHRPITLLDGDIVRLNLSQELGFSKEHRDINIKRIGFVASQIVKSRGIAFSAAIAPYASVRDEVRNMVSDYGTFIEIHVSTPIETCEERDVKGLYQKARAGIIKGFTGIDDPYETPTHPEIAIDTSKMTVKDGVETIIAALQKYTLVVPQHDHESLLQESVS